MAVTINGTGPITGLTTIASPTTINGLTIPTTSFGKIVQVVNALYNTSTTSTSTTYADTGLTATITPTLASSKVLVLVTVAGVFRSSGNSGTGVFIQVLRGATSIIAIGDNVMRVETSVNNTGGNASGTILDTPNTISATTYKAQFKTNNSGQTVGVQYGGVESSSITLMEVAA